MKAKAILLDRPALAKTHTQFRVLAKVRVQDEDPKSCALKSIERLDPQLYNIVLVSIARSLRTAA